MTYFTLHRILALINIFILLLLAADEFMLPVTHVREVYDFRSSFETRGGYSYHNDHSTDYINTVSGDEFQVPANWQYSNIGLNKGDTFYVDESLLFRQPLVLFFRWKGGFGKMKMNVLNNGDWGPLLALYILIVSLIQLLPWRLIRNDNLNERFIFSGSALLLVLLFFVFYR
jgi:hypothetical protein